MLYCFKSIASVFVILTFLLLAFACADDDGYNSEGIDCDPIDEKYYENGYVTCNPIPYVEKQNDILLTVLDKESGKGIEGLYVKVSWNQFGLDTVNCSGQCFGLLSWDYNVGVVSGGYTETTDANGQINCRTGIGYHHDERDVQLASIRIEDFTGKYAPRMIAARFNHTTSLFQKTIYLLNNESL